MPKIQIRSLNQITPCLTGHNQIWHHIFFYQEILKYLNNFQNWHFSVSNNGSESKSNIFPWCTFKSDDISFFYRKTLKHFNDFQNWNFKMETMEMKQNQTFSHGTYSNLTAFLTRRKVLIFFNDSYYQDFSISIYQDFSFQKWAQTGKVI